MSPTVKQNEGRALDEGAGRTLFMAKTVAICKKTGAFTVG
jgi:hypothetical protein